MKTFKAKKSKSKYKNTNAWLDAVYRNNKDIIDKELSFAGSPKKIFKQMVAEYMDEGLTATKAVSTIARSTLFTTQKERLQTNFYEGLKADRTAYQTFRELTKERGKYSSFDRSKLEWDKEDKVYRYNKDVIISFQNSPYAVIVWRVQNEQNS